MYDQVAIVKNALTVKSGNSIQKFKAYFIWILTLFGTLFSITICRHIDSPLKYLSIPIFIALIAYYKFVYLKLNSDSALKLYVSESEIKYYDGICTYIIPVTGIKMIEDRSKYHDFQGKNEHGWNHTFAIQLRADCSVLRTDSSKEVHLTEEIIPELQVFNLVLKHSDYEDVLEYILRLL